MKLCQVRSMEKKRIAETKRKVNETHHSQVVGH